MSLAIWNPNRWTFRWSGSRTTETTTESIPPFFPEYIFVHHLLTLQVETPDTSFVLGSVTQVAEIGIRPYEQGAILPFHRLYKGISLFTFNDTVQSYQLRINLYERVKSINISIWEYTP